MLQETNAQLQKTIEKQRILIIAGVIFNIALGVFLLLNWTHFFAGSLFGMSLIALVWYSTGELRDETWKAEW